MKKKRNACADSNHHDWNHAAQQHHNRIEIDVDGFATQNLVYVLI